jgi:sirohydrochlorin cobaltochelatase
MLNLKDPAMPPAHQPDAASSRLPRAVLLIGHGSLRAGAGEAMLRLAENAQAAGVAPIVTAGFLNYSRPTFAEALARCVDSGAGEVIVQPYFLVPGKFVREDLARQVEAGQATHPALAIRLAQPLGDHPALARLLLKRAQEADRAAASPPATRPDRPRAGMLIMAHGSPNPKANAPIYGIARRVRASGHYTAVKVCFMDLNKPSIPSALDAMVAGGIGRIVAAPYFLQLGNHVKDDLPLLIEAARARHPAATIILAEHLAYDSLLVAAIADRVAEAV